MKKVNYSFQYKNQTSDNVKVWLANPPKTETQTLLSEEKRSPVQEYDDAIGNRISYYELAPGEQVHASYRVGLQEKTNGSSPLTDEEIENYTRSTVMIPVNEEIEEMAANVTEKASGNKEKAWLLFQYMIRNYTYKFPVKARGVDHFLKEKKGDCGEYSFLYASLCRSLGIPCRVMVGAFAMGKHQAHVWNEIYLEEEGWIPVDTSMAYTVRRQLWRFFFSSIRTLRWRKYFGQTENQRIVFSIGTEHTPSPAYPEGEEESKSPYETFPLAGQSFAWGKSSLHGKIPYFQPMYFYYQADKPHKLKRTEEALGSWEVKEAGERKRLLDVRKISGYLALFLAIAFLFTSWEITSILFPFPAFVYCLSFWMRKERPLFFSIATAFFAVISLLVTLGFLSEFFGA
ncbi:Transglutaminase-like enzyme, putative cysteine protease [Halobacillus dabanensis]|uniref:Transglutaminase-like enzyme, putative cysteine protease n=1 Tax=Halobacillus dabanensis TaxID=240302 RepID=A0A1I3S8P7_HALDA|nr:transglutaminase domain-containing protein [Halobacillus dabanensis]SFJ53927.1 Transglutaminase-like enzyme, putative cysteine protease [Halobacillus dabanensis]